MPEFDPTAHELKEIRIKDIDFGDRRRKELGDLGGLASDIREHGVITPIAVIDKTAISGEVNTHDDLDPDKPYLLAAGERRTRASMKAGLDRIDAKVFKQEVSEWQMRVIELHENVYRKDMTPYEEAQAEKDIHDLYVQRYGEAQPGPVEGGHSQEDTAEMVGRSSPQLGRSLEIAEWGKEYPEIREAETRAEARRLIKKKKKELAAKEKERRIEEEQQHQEESGEVEVKGKSGETKKYQKQITKRFIVGDYFEKMEDLPDGSIDILELDPDWGIDFIEKRASRNKLEKEAPYTSVPPEAYEETLKEILDVAWPKLKDHSWIILWYSIEEWHDRTWQILRDCGFSCGKMPAFWRKDTGNTATPAFRLGDTVAAFYYARKGNPRIQNMGRNNTFEYRTLQKSERHHPAEKPIELYQDILNTFGKKGQVVVSGFAGSGNCLLAAENLEMNGIGFDLETQNKSNFKIKAYDEEPGSYTSYNS